MSDKPQFVVCLLKRSIGDASDKLKFVGRWTALTWISSQPETFDALSSLSDDLSERATMNA